VVTLGLVVAKMSRFWSVVGRFKTTGGGSGADTTLTGVSRDNTKTLVKKRFVIIEKLFYLII
jgi:hypothetical protein